MIMELADVTDFDLYRAGLVSLDELEEEGPVMRVFECWSCDGWLHSWGMARVIDVEGTVEVIQVCGACGSVREARSAFEQTMLPIMGVIEG